MTHIAFLWMQFKIEDDAAKVAIKYQMCPKILFWGNKKNIAYIILRVPDENSFWSDFIAENPSKSFGGIKAEITYLDEMYVPHKESLSYQKVEGNITPCGSRCSDCPSRDKCTGCPSLKVS